MKPRLLIYSCLVVKMRDWFMVCNLTEATVKSRRLRPHKALAAWPAAWLVHGHLDIIDRLKPDSVDVL